MFYATWKSDGCTGVPGTDRELVRRMVDVRVTTDPIPFCHNGTVQDIRDADDLPVEMQQGGATTK